MIVLANFNNPTYTSPIKSIVYVSVQICLIGMKRNYDESKETLVDKERQKFIDSRCRHVETDIDDKKKRYLWVYSISHVG